MPAEVASSAEVMSSKTAVSEVATAAMAHMETVAATVAATSCVC
jgi:hypothetical protein